MFALAIWILSPVYYWLIKGVYICVKYFLRFSYATPSIRQKLLINNGHSNLYPTINTPTNVNSSHTRTFQFSSIEDAEIVTDNIIINERTTHDTVGNESGIAKNMTNDYDTSDDNNKKDKFTKCYVASKYQDQPIYELITNVLQRCCRKNQPSPTSSARVFYYLFEQRILSQAMGGLDQAAYYFDKKILGYHKSAFSTELSKLTNNTYNNKYKSVITMVDEEMERLNIKPNSGNSRHMGQNE